METKVYEWPFALFSAHLHHFLPTIPWKEHEELYQRFVAFHKQKAHDTPEIKSNTDLEKLVVAGPALLCLYHLGHHFETVLALGRAGLRFDVLLDRVVYQRHEQTFLNLQTELRRAGNSYRFLFSDDRTVLLKVRTALREGRQLVVFADGNSGTAAKGKDLRTAVNFMSGTLQVKTGIAMISHLLQVPLLALDMEFTGVGCSLKLLEQIDPAGWADREVFMRHSMQRLYDRLSERLNGVPWKWECWSYLHQNGSFDPGQAVSELDREKFAPAENEDNWLPVAFEGAVAAFDRISYQLIR